MNPIEKIEKEKVFAVLRNQNTEETDVSVKI